MDPKNDLMGISRDDFAGYLQSEAVCDAIAQEIFDRHNAKNQAVN